MRVAVAGGGPGGLFFATLLRRADPSIAVTVFERNRAEDTFGFGVVFSDRTLAGIHEADPVLRTALAVHGRHWDDIEVRLKGERIRCGGNGMASIARRTLLSLMQDRARGAGADLRFSTDVDLDDLDGYDLVVAADGAGSRIRERLAADLDPSVEVASAKFIWFGTDYMFDGLTFVHERGPHGVFAVHGYPISANVSTFIVETDEASWRAAGFDGFDVTQPPGPSDKRSRVYLERLFAEQIDGARLLVNNSRWANFRTRRTGRWYCTSHGNMALLGDAAHTAHFSVGSGTKMAMEDAVALATTVTRHRADLPVALAEYEAAARPSVEAIQGSARPSLAWWERFGRYYDAFEPWQFAFHFLSRSITAERLARRAPDFVRSTQQQWARRHRGEPLQSPLRLAGGVLSSRMMVVERTDAGIVVARPTPGGCPPPLPGLPLLQDPPGDVRWGAWVAAPDDGSGLTGVLAGLAELVVADPVLVAVHGGTPHTRTLVSEEVRLRHGLVSLLVDDGLDRDQATTAVLAGRTDLVGATSAVVATWSQAG